MVELIEAAEVNLALTDADKIATGSAHTHTYSHRIIHMTYTQTSNRSEVGKISWSLYAQ